MSGDPILLRSAAAIADHLEVSPAQLQGLVRLGLVPVWKQDGHLVATVAGLDDWKMLLADEKRRGGR